MSFRVLFAYDQPNILHALTTLMERQGCADLGEALNAQEAFRMAEKHRLEVAIVDIDGPGSAGSLGHFSRMTVHTDKAYVLNSLEKGIKAYVLNHRAPRELPLAAHLTERERQVIRLIADGYSTKQVAATLGISVKTAETHRTNIMEKLGVHETASLVRSAIRLGLVEP